MTQWPYAQQNRSSLADRGPTIEQVGFFCLVNHEPGDGRARYGTDRHPLAVRRFDPNRPVAVLVDQTPRAHEHPFEAATLDTPFHFGLVGIDILEKEPENKPHEPTLIGSAVSRAKAGKHNDGHMQSNRVLRLDERISGAAVKCRRLCAGPRTNSNDDGISPTDRPRQSMRRSVASPRTTSKLALSAAA